MNMFSRFGQIFWGLLLLILDFKMNEFDVLPDVIGYILVAVGCGGLASLSKCFSTAQTLSWILMTLALIGVVLPSDYAGLYGFVLAAIECGLVWYLLGGVMEFATARERLDLARRASKCRVTYVVLICVAALIGSVAHVSRNSAGLMVIFVVIATFFLMVLILHLLHRVKHELTTYE